MKKLLGWPTRGHWIPLRPLKVTLKGQVKEGTGHRLAPEPAAKVEVALELGVNLEAIAELRAKIIPRAAHGMYTPGPLMDPHPGGE